MAEVREEAERLLDRPYSESALGTGYALLDLADAVRDVAEAISEGNFAREREHRERAAREEER